VEFVSETIQKLFLQFPKFRKVYGKVSYLYYACDAQSIVSFENRP
jgi:hypothetical protein